MATENLHLAYGATESSECGMKLQELDLARHSFPFKSSRFTVEPGGSSPPDNHSVAEMWIIVEGAGELVYSDQSHQVKAGDAIYFEPFHTHQIRNHASQPLKVLSFWWQTQCST